MPIKAAITAKNMMYVQITESGFFKFSHILCFEPIFLNALP